MAAGFSTESVKDKSSYKLIVPVPPSGDLFVNWLGSNISKLLPVRDDEPKDQHLWGVETTDQKDATR